MKQTLEAWLGALEQRGPAPIALGLDRVSTVYRALCDQRAADRAAPLVFVVAGTNGKGSTVAYLDSILRASGMRCGRYTSPHLIRFAERIVVNGVQVDDALIVETLYRPNRGPRLIMGQAIKRGEQTLCKAELEAVIIDPDGRPKRPPKFMIEAWTPVLTSPSD